MMLAEEKDVTGKLPGVCMHFERNGSAVPIASAMDNTLGAPGEFPLQPVGTQATRSCVTGHGFQNNVRKR